MSRRPERFPFAQLNLGSPSPREGRTAGGMDRTVHAVANVKPKDRRRRRPKLFALEETLGWAMPDLPGYRKIRDTSTPGRANLTLYVADQLDVKHVEWPAASLTWPRTEHAGIHPARAFLKARVADTRVIVGHAPPTGPGTEEARREWVRMAADLCDTDAPVIFLCDHNALLHDVRVVLGAGRMFTPGAGDGVLVRGFDLEDPRAVSTLNGTRVQTDHRTGVVLGRAVRL